MQRGITFGVWDLFHYGHLRFLERASQLVDELIVGVCSDVFTLKSKGQYPVIDNIQRVEIVRGLKCVKSAFIYHAPDYADYFNQNACNVIIVGEDFGLQGVAEHEKALNELPFIRLERTPLVSSTEIKERILKWTPLVNA